MPQIVANKIGKRFKRYSSHWNRLAEWVTGGLFCGHEPHWALKSVNFQINQGESVGIVGHNGAGKSTLLKILTGTTQTTKGSVQISGRIAALLELGMGFHPDFTGRENAIISCQMTGIGRKETHKLLPEIERFSELGKYFDQPLRVYSTGMQMRLAFSAATAVCPDILIIDEALSVGDAYFQHKCINRIRTFKKQGTTLLFVSHDPGAVKSLCNRAILLDKGALCQDGPPNAVLDYYNGLIAKNETDTEIKQIETDRGKTETRCGNGKARILKVELFDSNGKPTRAFRVGDMAKIKCHIKFNVSMENPTVGILIRDRLGNDVFGTNTHHLDTGSNSFKAGDHAIVTFALSLNLGCENYSITIGVHSGDTHLEGNCDWWDQCLVFQVIPNDSYQFIGLASLPVTAEFKGDN